MSARSAWMPLYIGDYMRDTGHLTTIEHGAYLLLIMHAWGQDGALPGDEDRLRIIAKMDVKDWRRSGTTLLEFFVRNGAAFRHKRIDAEIANAKANVEQRRAAGRASAERRAQQRKPNGKGNGNDNDGGNGPTNENPTPVATPVAAPSQRNAIPSPSPSPRKKDSELRSGAADASPPDLAPDVRSELWLEGAAIVCGLTGLPEKRAKALIGKLCRDADDDCARVLAVLHEARDTRPVDPVPWLVAAIAARREPRNGFLALIRDEGIGVPANPVAAFLENPNVH